MSFETQKSAEERIVREKDKQKKKDHTGKIGAMAWDKQGVKVEVEGYADGTDVNWSDLARRYGGENKKGENAKNGGQIIQQYLVNEGINFHRFKRKHGDEMRIRRKKLHGLGGEITVPAAETNEDLKNKLKIKIQRGEYTLGELTVAHKYKKFALDKENGSIKVKEFVEEGRKIPLNEIKKKTIEKFKCYSRNHPDLYYDEMPWLTVMERIEKAECIS